MLDSNQFDCAPDVNGRILQVNRKNADKGFFIDLSVMNGYEDTEETTSLECIQAERRDKDGNLIEVLSNYMTESEAMCWLDGYEAASEGLWQG